MQNLLAIAFGHNSFALAAFVFFEARLRAVPVQILDETEKALSGLAVHLPGASPLPVGRCASQIAREEISQRPGLRRLDQPECFFDVRPSALVETGRDRVLVYLDLVAQE